MVICKLTNEIRNITENDLEIETCENGHTADSLTIKISKTLNIFLKNYYKKNNRQLSVYSQKEKRKLITLYK